MKLLPALLCSALLLADVAQARAPASAPPAHPGWAKQAQSWITHLWSRDDSAAWLAKIGSALRENNYQGILVQTAAGQGSLTDKGFEFSFNTILGVPGVGVLRPGPNNTLVGEASFPINGSKVALTLSR